MKRVLFIPIDCWLLKLCTTTMFIARQNMSHCIIHIVFLKIQYEQNYLNSDYLINAECNLPGRGLNKRCDEIASQVTFHNCLFSTRFSNDGMAKQFLFYNLGSAKVTLKKRMLNTLLNRRTQSFFFFSIFQVLRIRNL